MASTSSDFLQVIDSSFSNRDEFMSQIDRSYRLGKVSGEFNIIGAVNNLSGGKEEFSQQLNNRFEVIQAEDDLRLLYTEVDSDPVYTYVYLDDNTPIFLTNANKTDQIPPTIISFLREFNGVGRLMLSRREVDEMRKEIVNKYNNVIIPFFSAQRTRDASVGARRRPDTERSIQYRGIDGLDTYREMRYNYGILPRIMKFEKTNKFKFKIKENGTFIHMGGGILPLWECLKGQITRVEEMMEYANTGNYHQTDSSFFGENKFNVSTPWAVEVEDGIKKEHLETLPSQFNDSFWEFSVSEYDADLQFESFEAELIDEATHERTTLKSKGSEVRVFPRENTDIDQSLRIFNFLGDHFDTDCSAKKVA